MEKMLNEITRQEWIAFRWAEIPPQFGDSDERIFRTVGKRTPTEAYEALQEWEMTADERSVNDSES
jgi:hypothetical protein